MKISTNNKFLEQMIAEGEHQQQDFKFEISSAKKIAKSLSAFANTSGGRLLIGVKDNGKIAGVNSEEEQYMIDAAAQIYCKPQVEYKVGEYAIEGKTILLVDIPESKNKPILATDIQGKSWAYVRIKNENILANKVHLEVWKNINKPLGEFISYTKEEKLLLQTLQNQGHLTINQISKITTLKRNRVIKLLTKFILFKVIEPTFTNRQFTYQLI